METLITFVRLFKRTPRKPKLAGVGPELYPGDVGTPSKSKLADVHQSRTLEVHGGYSTDAVAVVKTPGKVCASISGFCDFASQNAK